MAHTQEPPSMPMGRIVYTGRYPGYEPAQAMETFFLASADHDRPSYEERRDSFWAFDGGGYALVVGCFVEPDGTPVIALTSVSKSAGSAPPAELFMGEVFSVLKPSAESMRAVMGDEDIIGPYGATLRQLRPGELDGGAPNHIKDFVLGAVDHLYPGLREDVWPDHAAGIVSEGKGVIVTYNNDRFQVATIVLSDLQISTELLEGITEVNVKLPIGSVFLSSIERGWCAIWKYKLLGGWLDPGSQVSGQMVGDILINAPNMTQMAREMLQAKECGGSAFTVEPGSGWGLITMSHV